MHRNLRLKALSFEGALFYALGGDEMGGSTIFDYYYGDESNLFSVYRIPRQLITGDAFKSLSTDAKLLYGLLLDRIACPQSMVGTMNKAACISITRWRRYRQT